MVLSTIITSSLPSATLVSVSCSEPLFADPVCSLITHLDPLFVATLPYSIRVLLESAVRNCDDFSVKEKDINTILNWAESSQQDAEIPFRPARVILQDFT